MADEVPYNPLDKVHLGESVATRLLRKDAVPLGSLGKFNGAGIYAIYYLGDFPQYSQISACNRDGRFELPIYVGKAIPPGGRKGGSLSSDPAYALYKRLQEHAETIAAASSTIKLEDFYCRYLVVEDIWIPLGESLLINWFQPLWNRVIDGFGNHDPGAGRYSQKRSPWDVVHPGRGWAERCAKYPKPAEAIFEEVAKYEVKVRVGEGAV